MAVDLETGVLIGGPSSLERQLLHAGTVDIVIIKRVMEDTGPARVDKGSYRRLGAVWPPVFMWQGWR